MTAFPQRSFFIKDYIVGGLTCGTIGIELFIEIVLLTPAGGDDAESHVDLLHRTLCLWH
jgi:hypothetical protein